MMKPWQRPAQRCCANSQVCPPTSLPFGGGWVVVVVVEQAAPGADFDFQIFLDLGKPFSIYLAALDPLLKNCC